LVGGLGTNDSISGGREIHTLATSRLTEDCWEDTVLVWSDEVAGDNSRNNSDSTDVSGKVIAMLSPNTATAITTSSISFPCSPLSFSNQDFEHDESLVLPRLFDSKECSDRSEDPNTISDVSDGSIGSCSNQEWRSTRGHWVEFPSWDGANPFIHSWNGIHLASLLLHPPVRGLDHLWRPEIEQCSVGSDWRGVE
jgi:hypothetical protein